MPVRCSYNVTHSSVPDYGWEFTLQKNGDGPYGDDISTLSLSVYCDAPHRVRIIIRDASSERWEVPAFLRHVPLSPPSAPCADTLYKFTSTLVDGVSGFRVRRAASETLLFDTASSSLVYSPQYIELSSSLPSGHMLFGLGQRLQSLRLPPAVYTMWNVDNGTAPQRNMYGSHPAYWRIEDDGSVHAVVMYNSNAMDVVLAEQSVTYRMTGGVVDLYLLLGPTPADVAAQYTELVGRPWLPPLWSLGFHTCRWGLENISYTRGMVDAYAAAEMPLDAVWHDIDYMSYYADFTFDSARFGTEQLRAFNMMLASRGQHHVYIVDPGIPALLTTASNRTYAPYVQGRERDVFIRHPSNDSAIFACVWPSVPVAFPDFSHPAAQDWWREQIALWTEEVGLPSGLWLDMNEISSFVQGELLPADGSSCLDHEPTGPDWSNLTLAPPAYQPVVAPDAHYHNASAAASDIPLPPYSPGGIDLAARSLNTSAILWLSQFYNLHNLYGQLEQRVSRIAMEQLLQRQRDDRPTRAFTLSRATFLGSGREGASWTGDHDGGWADLAGQVVMLQQMGLHGVTMVGSDLCGLGSLDSTGDDGGAEVCARWLQLGALSPFARLHYQDWNTSRHREPYAWPEPALSMNRRSLQLRYSLLLYLSSLSLEASRTGRPLWRPMFFEFVNDSATWLLDAQLMLGPALLFPPVTQPLQQQVQVYLPSANWFDFHTGALLYSPPAAAAGADPGGVVKTIAAPYAVNADVPLLQRGGTIVVTQSPGLTTAATVLNPLIVKIALDLSGRARGAVYLEDGISADSVDRGDYHVIVFDAELNVTAPFSSDFPPARAADRVGLFARRELQHQRVQHRQHLGAGHHAACRAVEPDAGRRAAGPLLSAAQQQRCVLHGQRAAHHAAARAADADRSLHALVQ